MLKKTLVLILCSLMLSSSVCYAGESVNTVASGNIAIAASDSKDDKLKNAILKFKETFGATDDYTDFDSYESTYGNITSYILTWGGSSSRPDISAEIGDDGKIYSYRKDSDVNYDTVSIPEITKAEALAKAYDFTIKIAPELAGLISTDFAQISYSQYFNVTFFAVSNGFVISENTSTVTLGKDGDVCAYRRNITNGMKLPQTVQPLSNDEIIKILKEKLPMELVYTKIYAENEKVKDSVKLTYRLPNEYSDTALNAETGEIVKIEEEHNKYYGNSFDSENESMSDSAAPAAEQISEAEKKNIEMRDTFISAEKAYEKVLLVSEFASDSSYKMVRSVLSKHDSEYTDKSVYYWAINFENAERKHAYASINAETGEIMSYGCYGYAERNKYSELKNNEDACRAAAEKFIAAYYPSAAETYVLSDDYSPAVYSDDDYVSSFGFRYVRTVNGIKFENDSIYIDVNADSLKILNFSYFCSDAKFPTPQGTITADTAADKYFASIAPTKNYIVCDNISDGTAKISDISRSNNEKTLLLTSGYGPYAYVDAKNGKVTDYNGDAFVYEKPQYYIHTEFNDIDGSEYKEQINILANMDIIPFAEQYNPQLAIKHGEFAEMLKYFGNYNYYEYMSAAESNTQLDTEKPAINPNAAVTHEDAAKIIISSMGYSDVAKIKDIFKCDYTDADTISKDNIGYVAIARALGLFSHFGDTFNPSAKLTKGEAAALIYNYMTYNLEK